jgi:hypothetical protein
MSKLVLNNLDSLKAQECISVVDNADKVFGGFGFTLSFVNQTTKIDTLVENVLNINRDLPSLTTINQVASLPGGTTVPNGTTTPSGTAATSK